jgi:hypothetical protein
MYKRPERMPVSEEAGKGSKRRRMSDPMSWKAWAARQRFLRWRKFTWLPGELEITVPGKEHEKRTAERDEEA